MHSLSTPSFGTVSNIMQFLSMTKSMRLTNDTLFQIKVILNIQNHLYPRHSPSIISSLNDYSPFEYNPSLNVCELENKIYKMRTSSSLLRHNAKIAVHIKKTLCCNSIAIANCTEYKWELKRYPMMQKKWIRKNLRSFLLLFWLRQTGICS
jgi:hypothetical protein